MDLTGNPSAILRQKRQGAGHRGLGFAIGESRAWRRRQDGGALVRGYFPARAKSVIYLFMAGAPSQIDTFDYKPKMADWYDKVNG